MAHKVFISYSHRLDKDAADEFARTFSERGGVFIDKSERNDLGDIKAEAIKNHLRSLIRDASVTIVLIGAETGGRAWVDWEIRNSLLRGSDNRPNGLLGIRIPHKQHCVPDRLQKNLHMGLIEDWPKGRLKLEILIAAAIEQRKNGTPDLSDPQRKRNSSRQNP